jgi:hypothetical protein
MKARKQHMEWIFREYQPNCTLSDMLSRSDRHLIENIELKRRKETTSIDHSP